MRTVNTSYLEEIKPLSIRKLDESRFETDVKQHSYFHEYNGKDKIQPVDSCVCEDTDIFLYFSTIK